MAEEAKYPMQAALATMYTATMTITIPVPTIANAFSGLKARPSPSVTATVIRKVTRMATTGERCRGRTRAATWGKAPIRPIA